MPCAIALSRRLIRFRVTALPTVLATMNPNRDGPVGSVERRTTDTTTCAVALLRPRRTTFR